MNRLTTLIEKNISGKKVLGLFVATNVVYVFMLAVSIPRAMELASGLKLLDMMPAGYDRDYVNELFRALGEEGRRYYLTRQLPVDFIYPLLFGWSYCLLLGYFLNKLNQLKTPLVYLCLLPVMAGFFDYSENIGIIALLNAYPDLAHLTVSITSVFSVLKSMTTSVFFIALIIVLLSLGVSAVKNKH